MFIIRQSAALRGVVFVRLEGAPTDEELRAYIDAQRVESKNITDKSVTILEFTEVWTARQRRMMKDFEQEMLKAGPSMQLGMAAIITSVIIRGAFQAYLWLAPTPYPTTVVANAESAYPFVKEQLEKAGMPAPSEQAFKSEARNTWPARVYRPGSGLVAVTEEELTRLAS